MNKKTKRKEKKKEWDRGIKKLNKSLFFPF